MPDAFSTLFQGTAELTFIAMAVFVRVGAAMFLLPGFGERSVPMRFRLGLAFLVALLLAPLLTGFAGQTPQTPAPLVALLAAEAFAGLIIGAAFRFLIYALQVAGTMAAQNISISHMFGTGVAPESEPTLASFLALGGIALALMLGLHVQAVRALASLYAILPIGVLIDGAELADWSISRVSETFALALTLALPFVAVGFAYNMALGALSRAMPQLLVALIGVPLLVGLGMAVLWVSLPEIYTRWSEALFGVFQAPLGGLG